MARFLSTQPVVLNLPTVIPTLPTRGGTVLARSVLASPGGGFIGLATATQMGVETGMLSVLGTGPNSFMVRRELLKHGARLRGLDCQHPSRRHRGAIALAHAGPS